MQAILLYLLKSIICCGILLGYYWVALRNKQFHYYNRFYLLFSLAVSLFVPALNIDWFSFESSSDKAIALLNVLYMQQDVQNITVQASRQWDWQDVAFASTILVSSAMLVLLLFRIAKIYRLKKNYPQTSMDEFDFINTDLQQAPFSFLNNLFWRSDLSMEDATGRQIMQHEITHIKQKHTWDKLFVEAVLSICWMNPFLWLMRRELWLIHEFIADEQSVKDKDASAFAAMLLRQQYGNQIFSPAQPFNYSPIKRRLHMLTTSKEPRYSYARRLMSLPLLALVIFLFAFRLHKKDDADFNAVKDAAVQYEVAQVIDDTVTKADEEILPAAVIRQDTVKTFGTYEGKKVIDVFVNADKSKVILTFEDNSTKKISYGEAKQNGIKINAVADSSIEIRDVQLSELDVVNVDLKKEKQPLCVLNGKVIEAQDFKKVSPSSIESINVLKDASATSLYGVKGKNGVILITTKKDNDIRIDGIKPGAFYQDSSNAHKKVFKTVQIQAQFPGGPEAWEKYLERNLRADIPVENGAPVGRFTVVVSFIVDIYGNVSDVKAINDPGYGTAPEAERMIRRGPKWEPAVQNGKRVNYLQKQSITFEVSAG